MTTIVLGALGAAAGASIGGGVLGLSSVVIGRAIGATLGRVIDQRLLGSGSAAVETGRVERFRVTGASEGAPLAKVYGRARIGGQVIWSGPFIENVRTSGGGKGAPSKPKTKEYSYSVSLAIALCEGVISHVGRIWADGEEIAARDLGMKVYPGDFSQLPDPAIEAALGAGETPAFRGTAYVVFENLDLAQFGNRVPQFSFEVFRPAPLIEGLAEDPGTGTKAVAMIPGTGEYALATTAVHYKKAAGVITPANINTPLGVTDFAASLEAMTGELPNVGSVSLVVSWFGNDLRCGSCTVTPRVEQKATEGDRMAWRVSGLTRAAAALVPYEGDRPLYGATPADQSVVEAIVALKAKGLKVMLNPFVLMDQIEGNTLPDPWTGVAGQPVLPWRGRITTSLAPGVLGSPDGTATADTQVAAFFGSAAPGQFTVSGTTVNYTGSGSGYRRFILHYAKLCQAAGGVDAFLLGSELRGLTQIRGASGFPAVQALKTLAAEVRAILGPMTKIGYGADWSEYAGYTPPGTSDLRFPLDPLWSDTNVNFVGIDNYAPLADWRDAREHLDAAALSPYSLTYLQDNIEGGEAYDWYYAGPAGREAQARLPITDGAYDEPWVWRAKDIKSWWSNEHFERFGGVRAGSPTAWQPGMKPVWFTEYGCSAIDKGANEPNRFLDVKSSESGLPFASNGRRDDFMQMQALRAVQSYWADPANNPSATLYAGRMIDMDRAHVWAFDARPFPWFPNAEEVWSDGGNYARGHWLNGRASGRSLALIVAEICGDAGLGEIDVSELYGYVRGFVADGSASPRAVLQTLMLAYGFDAIERDGVLVFRSRGLRDGVEVDRLLVALDGDADGDFQLSRQPEAEVAGRIRVNYTESEGSYETRTAEAVFADEAEPLLSVNDMPLVLTAGEARAMSERWLAEARIARDAVSLALPPSRMAVGAGDVIAFEGAEYRVDRLEDRGLLALQATRIEDGIAEPSDTVDAVVRPRSFVPPLPVFPVFLDLPLMSGAEVSHAPHLAVTARPWPGSAAIYRSSEDAGYVFERLEERRATLGLTESVLAAAPVGRFDRKGQLQVVLTQGELSSATRVQLMNGANLAAIGDGSPGNWELIQFATATLVAPNTYELTGLLRGQAGTDGAMPLEWPLGSTFVLIDGAVAQVQLDLGERRLERHYRIGPAGRPFDDPSYEHVVAAFDGVGLRPYAPAHLGASPVGGDLAVTWVRRTRINGDSWESAEVPLGETTEAYRVRVMNGVTILREVVVGAPSWTYPAGLQALDGPGPREIAVAQIGEVWGAGSEARLAVTL
jgi:hypothetical protein